MKKNLLFVLSFATILLAGCINSDKEIDSNTWLSDEGLSVEQVFNNQIDEAQYLKDMENYISYDILSSTENKPFTSDFSLDVKFDEKSSLQGGMTLSQKKNSKSYDLESRDIEFDIEARNMKDDSEPFEASGNITLLYQDNEMYANIHDFGLFMGEGNMVAKMYTLLGNTFANQRINLEINSGGIISLDTEGDVRLQNMIGIIKNVLKTEDIHNSPNFLASVAELIDMVGSHINLGISVDGLTIKSLEEIKYFETSEGVLQKEFKASFQGGESSFDLSFVASKEGLEIRISNIKEFDEDLQEFKDVDSEFLFSLKEIKKSKYEVEFESIKYQQTVAKVEGNIDFGDTVKLKADFILEPLELIEGQKISGNLEGSILKQSGGEDMNLPELSGNIILISDVLASL